MSDKYDRFMQYFAESLELRDKYEDVFPNNMNDMWVEVDYATHPIRPWCQEEFCVSCGQPATHKVEETTGDERYHSLTAYICCTHFFWGYCKPIRFESFDQYLD